MFHAKLLTNGLIGQIPSGTLTMMVEVERASGSAFLLNMSLYLMIILFSELENYHLFVNMKVVAYDFGIKQNILRRLASYGCKITVVPSTWPASEVLRMNPDGVLFSNGPGDPSAVPYAVEAVREIIGKVPVFGICMGHQLLGQALGGKTFKMKFGHHGGNHPVRDLRNGRVEISAQVAPPSYRNVQGFFINQILY